MERCFTMPEKKSLLQPVTPCSTSHGYVNTPFNVMDASYINHQPLDDILRGIHDTVKNYPVYLTFDIDCLGPAYAPGTGTPVCGGLNMDRAMYLLPGLQGLNIAGMDIVEVAHSYDYGEVMALAGATLALEMLYL